MRKYIWGITAGVCVLALLVMGAFFIPSLFTNSTQVHQGQELIAPGHWWKMELTEQQLSSLAIWWGENITTAQLLQELWPEVLQELPPEALKAYENKQIYWPTEEYVDWEGQMICGLRGIPHDEGMLVYAFYLGSSDGEERTFYYDVEDSFTADRMFRVSLYTDGQQR